ncbi:MAG: glycosyltransferase [Hyphomicrobium sp.]|nr:glycosyltransferase [Hyphomicrobium sp.]
MIKFDHPPDGERSVFSSGARMSGQHLRWLLRRWTPSHLFYRARLPFRRRLRSKRRETFCAPFAKRDDAQPTTGPALVFGEFSGMHGLGRAAAYDVGMLEGRHSSVHTIDISSHLNGEQSRLPELHGPFENVYLFCQPDTYDTVFRLLNPNDVRRAYRVARWVWETPKFPNEWRFAERLVHEVWTPSAFCAEMFRKSLDLPVSVRPHRVSEPPETRIDIRRRLGVPREAFMGLAVMDIQSCPARKNPWAHVHAWQEAFGDDAAAILVFKIRANKRTKIVLDELQELIGDASNIRLLCDDLDNMEIAALHRAADVYLSLHRSEGFGLNINEALLLGKPVIATNWSANTEYGPHFKSYRGVPFRLVPYNDWLCQYPDGSFCWAEADVKRAASHLRDVRVCFNRSSCLSSDETQASIK